MLGAKCLILEASASTDFLLNFQAEVNINHISEEKRFHSFWHPPFPF